MNIHVISKIYKRLIALVAGINKEPLQIKKRIGAPIKNVDIDRTHEIYRSGNQKANMHTKKC